MIQQNILKKLGRLIFLIVLVNCIGYISSAYMIQDTKLWYHALPLSSLTPPDYVFGIVWSILLLLQAIAAFLVWGKASPRYFVLQLALNMLWSFVFFYLRRPDIAFAVVLLFIIAFIMNIWVFSKANKLAGALLVPTLLWVLFAVYLNAYIIF